jgi:hypothetical protein
VKNFFYRIRYLCTGNVEWVDENGDAEKEHLDWRTRWALFGPHAYNLKWVRRFGEQKCGCTVHPITRRKLLLRMDCPTHSNVRFFSDDDEIEPWHGHAKGSG